MGFRAGRVVSGLLIWVAVLVAACGRSENVGWADREKPEGVKSAAPADTASAAEPGAPDSLGLWRREYQALAQQLNPLQRTAMAEPEVAARWEALNADLEASLRENSDFYKSLLERRDEIEAQLARAERGAGTLSAEEQADLSRFYRNVQTELARARTTQIRGPEFSQRFAAFRSFLFERMRALEPDQVGQLDRFEQLDELLFQPLESEAPSEAEPPPDPNAPGPG